MNMDGSVVLVSGGSRGIGRGIAEAFVEAGATVIVSATTAESATRVAAELGPETQVRGIGLNIADPASVEAAAGLIKEEYGKLSVLVNNAGITRDNLLKNEGRGVGRCPADKSWRSVSYVPGLRAFDDPGQGRTDHQRDIGGRDNRESGTDQLLGGQGGYRGIYEEPCKRDCIKERHG